MSGRVVCRGWVEPRHPLLVLRAAPELGTRESDSICKACRLALLAQAKAAARVRLAVYLRAPTRTAAGVYDRMGAALRLRFVRRSCREDYRGYTLEVA